jgi:hypothetical protein
LFVEAVPPGVRWQGALLEPLVNTKRSTYIEFELNKATKVNVGVTTLQNPSIIDKWENETLFNLFYSQQARFVNCDDFEVSRRSSPGERRIGLHVFDGNLFVYVDGQIMNICDPVCCNLPQYVRFFVMLHEQGTRMRIITSPDRYEPITESECGRHIIHASTFPLLKAFCIEDGRFSSIHAIFTGAGKRRYGKLNDV